MMRGWLTLAAACALAALTSCTSVPTRFYTLVPQASKAPAATPVAGYRIDVLPVTIPARDDRPQLVVRQGDDRVALLENEEWIAPLADQVRSAVSAALSRRLGVMDVHGLPDAGDEPVYRIKLDVRRFESVAGRYARIDAAWSVHRKGGDGPAVRCNSSLEEPVGSGIGALVQGHQKALAALSGHIAGTVRAMAGGAHASCP